MNCSMEEIERTTSAERSLKHLLQETDKRRSTELFTETLVGEGFNTEAVIAQI